MESEKVPWTSQPSETDRRRMLGAGLAVVAWFLTSIGFSVHLAD